MDPLIKSQLLYQLSYAPEPSVRTTGAGSSKIIGVWEASQGQSRAGDQMLLTSGPLLLDQSRFIAISSGKPWDRYRSFQSGCWR